MPIFEQSHPFYSEALVYATTQVSMSFAHYLRSDQSLPPKSFVMNLGIVVSSILRNTEEVIDSFGGGGVLSRLIYDEVDASNLQTPQRAPDYRVPPEAWKMISQVCIGSAYERVISAIKAHYSGDPWKWPREVEYFHHVRNGCFHDNVFTLYPRGKRTTTIDPSRPPRWRTSLLVDDASVGGQAVFGGVLGSGDVPVLIGDIAARLQADKVI